jgi:hypothetical protein
VPAGLGEFPRRHPKIVQPIPDAFPYPRLHVSSHGEVIRSTLLLACHAQLIQPTEVTGNMKNLGITVIFCLQS